MSAALAALFFAALVAPMSSDPVATPPTPADAASIAARIDRLGVVGSVLFVAAHPDDENTRFLAWSVGEKGLRTAYLSMTRGDGGQNLVGTEQGDALGVVRTHELLEARAIDGAEQMFTRARDFGYSKTAVETLAIWGHDEALKDVVRALRSFRPDVVVTRFNALPPNHGHHTASAILAEEAFAAAADPARFPECGPPWKADRLVWNMATWNLPKDFDLSKTAKLDVGGFAPLRGESWGEVAARSRSRHKSQGFGSAAERGPLLEYFVPVAGTVPVDDPFSGLDFTWKRVPGGAKVASAVAALKKGYDLRAPHASVPALAKVRAALRALPDDVAWKLAKLRDVDALIVDAAALHLDARAKDPVVAAGERLQVALLAVNRSPLSITLVDAGMSAAGAATVAPIVAAAQPLPQSAPIKAEAQIEIAADAPITTPMWLAHPSTPGLFRIDDPALVNAPLGPPPIVARFTVEIAGERVVVARPLRFVRVDPVDGEVGADVEIVPPATATFARSVVMAPNGAAKDVSVVVAAGKDAVTGALRLEAPAGWIVAPSSQPFTLGKRGDEKALTFRVTPPKGAATTGARARVRAIVEVDGRSSSISVRTIAHAHIPSTTIRSASALDVVPLPIALGPRRIGYVPGPGDEVAEALADVGYDVTILSDERLAHEPLDAYDVIVFGVRAFNDQPRLARHKDKLASWVAAGGRVVVQYQTNSRVGPLVVEVAPFPLELSRDRVTDETATMTPIDPQERMWRAPNLLTADDQRGWVQERGLYFAGKRDPAWRSILTAADPGEAPLDGALVVAAHGKGAYVYTGLAFFRQLPAGVPGAYRLFANVLAK